jgi:hypothetical protein
MLQEKACKYARCCAVASADAASALPACPALGRAEQRAKGLSPTFPPARAPRRGGAGGRTTSPGQSSPPAAAGGAAAWWRTPACCLAGGGWTQTSPAFARARPRARPGPCPTRRWRTSFTAGWPARASARSRSGRLSCWRTRAGRCAAVARLALARLTASPADATCVCAPRCRARLLCGLARRRARVPLRFTLEAFRPDNRCPARPGPRQRQLVSPQHAAVWGRQEDPGRRRWAHRHCRAPPAAGCRTSGGRHWVDGGGGRWRATRSAWISLPAGPRACGSRPAAAVGRPHPRIAPQ